MATQAFSSPVPLTSDEEEFMKHEHERVKLTDSQQKAFDIWAGPKDPDVSDAKYWIEKNTELDFNAFSFKCLNLLIKQAVWRYHHCSFKWWLKVKDDSIATKWKSEALTIDWASYIENAHFTPSMADACISELRKKAEVYEQTGLMPVYDYCTAVIKSDSILNPEFAKCIQDAVKPLEDVPSDCKDWHPNSNDQVLDLVHPSLWPLVYGSSKVLHDRTIGVDDALEYCDMGTTIRQPTKAEATLSPATSWRSTSRNKVLSREFQWLPCDVDLDRITGKAKIASYINNLHPVEQAHLYPIIEKLIEKSLPAWDLLYNWEDKFAIQRLVTSNVQKPVCPCPEICGRRRACRPQARPLAEGEVPRNRKDLGRNARDKAWFRETHGPALPDADPEAKDHVKFAACDIRSSGFFGCKDRCQVIVKLANIHLTPENPEYKGGSWHTEGLLNEHIVSTALYYYDCENITDCTLNFRTCANREDLDDSGSRTSLDYEQYDWWSIKQAFAIEPRGHTFQNVGSVQTKGGRALFFPNLLQHQVSPFKLADPSKPGHRKIVALFLVDPAIPIISTSNVPPQQKHWWPAEPKTGPLPAPASDDQGLIQWETAQEEWVDSEDAWLKARESWEQSLSRDKWPIGMEQAKELRKELMAERTWMKEKEADWLKTEWNFCEH
ncbi:hypothetical protein CABS01_15864 [Colletotrichum abscissum]|uniref:DUF4246 domain-containing protein n=1 Tax=Colletotrichum abscissum TaxID=1671311 RepID=A0A9P9X454_9PEZI|nr:uncharacterized protein CABS01_15864 [Colletotrichum abscissum]KAI3535659.1 hypothetical protein CABS02_12848 [Colletotrichum abscissum]KAK1474402.1 hypothetical protein CABS01_15864 [Colletotrichum abscissum]